MSRYSNIPYAYMHIIIIIIFIPFGLSPTLTSQYAVSQSNEQDPTTVPKPLTLNRNGCVLSTESIFNFSPFGPTYHKMYLHPN